ncbi:17-beta-hydroxysteroid dehydrogenase type 1 isoform X1 [Vulpes vulpes]|uniref:17-beta-hydroxysteroid dehydrogenase type 1 isoform X1 n=1 Tax=Vulpes vulpes TaxID=9627 RepID=A0ABM4ZLB3_VULVU
MDRTVVLITGCSSGIGLHLALRLASDPSRSFKVYATLRDLGTQGPLWEAARSRGCPPGSLETLQLDVRDADSVAAARARVTEGRVDVLVCNAGRGLLGPLEAHAAGAVESVLDVNVAGTVRTLQAFLPDMKRRGSGRILGCHSTLFTAPASSRSRVCARAWRFCSRPSGSTGRLGPRRLVTGPRSPSEEACQPGALMRVSLTPTGCGSGRGRVRFGGTPPPEGSGYPLVALGPQREPHRVRPGAHRLPGEAGGRPGRGAGRRGRQDPPPLLQLPAPFGADLPRGGAGPGGGDGGLPHRAARPAPGPALLQHRALPALGAPALGRLQRPQLRRRHAPRGVRRRARAGGGRRRGPAPPRAPRSPRRPAIKAWPTAACSSLLGAPAARGSGQGARLPAAPHVCDKWHVQRVGDPETEGNPAHTSAETELQKLEGASPPEGRVQRGGRIP